MANLTITVDEEILKRARLRALREGTSVNRLLRERLESYVVFVPTEKELISSEWEMLEPGHRADGTVFHRYQTAVEPGLSADDLASRIASLLRRR